MFGIFFQYGGGRLTKLSGIVNVKCCVPGCASKSQGFRYLKFHQLPKDNCRRKIWKNSIKNAKKISKWFSICSLHFKGGWKDFYANPSIFPWSQEWPDVVESYNKFVVEKFMRSQAIDHTYACMPNLMEVPTCTVTPATDTTIQVNRSLLFICDETFINKT